MLASPLTRRTQRVRRGFTLVEILAVVAIIVILAGLATFGVVNALQGAKENECRIRMQSVVTACKSYYTANGSWPQSIEVLIQPINGRSPMLEGGPSAISDPWNGQEFGYQVTPDQYGAERVVLTATTPQGITIQWPEK